MNRWSRGILIAFALIPVTAWATNPDIVVVKSSDNSYFNQTIETLAEKVDGAVRFRVISSDALQDSPSDTVSERIYVALGMPAAQAVGGLAEVTNSFNAYLTYEQYLEFKPLQQTTVLLDQPLYRYLGFCRLLLGMDSVGVITGRPLELGTAEKRLVSEQNVSLNQYRIDENNKLLPVLRRLMQENDVLLMLPRMAIYNRDTLKGVLLTSYRFRKPAISYSPAHVKAGALASIYSSPSDIGRHLAILINRRLRQPSLRTPSHEFARFYTISTNRRVARALDLRLPGERELRTRIERIEP